MHTHGVNMNVYSKGRIQQEIGLLGHGLTSSPDAAVRQTSFRTLQQHGYRQRNGRKFAGRTATNHFELSDSMKRDSSVLSTLWRALLVTPFPN